MGKLSSLNITKPGFGGLNTQETSPTESESLAFASVATNGVIDATGKLAAREDFVLQTAAFSGDIKNVFTHTATGGTQTIFSCTATNIYTGTTTLTSRAAGLGGGNWQFAGHNDQIFAVQAGLTPLVFASTFAAGAFTGTINNPTCCLSAFGRMWYGQDSTIIWSDLLDGDTVTGGDSGTLDLTTVWPNGNDTIVAIAEASNRLVIFGRQSIIVYQQAADLDPTNMTLQEPIRNVGCIARDSVVSVGDYLYFLSANGVRGLPRLTTVASQFTLIDVSKNVQDEILADIAAETLTLVRAGFWPSRGYYMLTFPTANQTYCFNVISKQGDNTTPRATIWTNVSMPFYGFAFDATGALYTGGTNGVFKYTGYTSDGAPQAYTFTYWTPWLDFAEALKHLKSLKLTLKADALAAGTLYWRCDYIEGTTNSIAFTCSAAEFAEAPGIGEVKLPIGRSCSAVKFGIAMAIAGDPVVLHNLRVFYSGGKTT